MRNLRDTKGRYIKTRLVYWTPESWDDGFLDKKGYFRVYQPDHPAATKSGWVHRYRAIWWIYYRQDVPKGKNIHHINGIKTDDHIDNLRLIDHGDHTYYHQHKAPIECTCNYCKQSFYLPQWRLNQGRGKYCSNECYYKHGGRWHA